MYQNNYNQGNNNQNQSSFVPPLDNNAQQPSTSMNNNPSPNQKPPKDNLQSNNSMRRKMSSLLRNLGILTVLLILLISSAFAYIILNPNSEISKQVVSRTPLDEFITLNNTDEENTGSSITEVKPGNVFFGLEEDDLSSQQSTVRLVSQTIPSVLSLRIGNGDSTTFRASADGTGFVASSGGLVVTNRHVVSQACGLDTPIVITGQDANANAYELKLVSIDPLEDIALLQIVDPGDTISPVVFGSSEELLLGEEVIAIGNVLGQLNNTVTRGIVSGLDRTLQTGLVDDCTGATIVADGVIQTDAAINKGNSGGPLFDASGQLVGMNTFGTTEAQNVGFAIPSNSIITAIRSYERNEKIIRPRLGIYSQVITPVDARDLDWLPVDYGEIITSPSGIPAITAGSAADEAGLQEGDIILEVNGERIEYNNQNSRPLRRLLLQYNENDEISLTVRKIVDTNNGIPEYEEENTTVIVTLGGISFEDFTIE
jgi:S1-C subfamily serine protease